MFILINVIKVIFSKNRVYTSMGLLSYGIQKTQTDIKSCVFM